MLSRSMKMKTTPFGTLQSSPSPTHFMPHSSRDTHANRVPAQMPWTMHPRMQATWLGPSRCSTTVVAKLPSQISWWILSLVRFAGFYFMFLSPLPLPSHCFPLLFSFHYLPLSFHALPPLPFMCILCHDTPFTFLWSSSSSSLSRAHLTPTPSNRRQRSLSCEDTYEIKKISRYHHRHHHQLMHTLVLSTLYRQVNKIACLELPAAYWVPECANVKFVV